KIPLFSLETKTKAKEFEMIGFSFQYELSFTNFINMLELAGINPFREQRSSKDPIIMGGGPTCFNPGILKEFVDLLVIGDGEEVLPRILEIYEEKRNKKDFLNRASKLKGVFVPGINTSVSPAVFKKFDLRYYPTDFPVAVVNIPNNRINLEINRGCFRKCRFCQARTIYSPYRQKSRKQILDLARESVSSTGYGEISLTSLSATDHTEILEIMDDLHYAFRELGVSVVLSSMRPDSFLTGLSDRLMRLRKGGLTFAPETPSEKLKKVLNKNVSNEDIIRAANCAKRKGWKKIKLYFMIGIPGETKEDIEEIPEFIKKVKKESGLNISATISPLKPQPHTPFQWLKNENPDSLAEKFNFIKKKSPALIKNFNPEQEIIERILSRGDKTLAKIVYTAYRNGARYDQWKENFNFSNWDKAFKQNKSRWQDYYYKEFEKLSTLPWDCVDAPVKKDMLRISYEKSTKPGEKKRRECLQE
ncbi:MAG: radical SAM protein, partial [Elusimicrobiota bacterium]